MPRVNVVLFQESDGIVPLEQWLASVPAKPRAKCIAALERLSHMGHELRRPEADYLRDGIHELRVRFRTVNYRMLYFFHGRAAVVVTHGLVKEDIVPPREIERAIRRKKQYEANPARHTFSPEDQ